MNDITVLRRISELIDEENELRSALQRTKPAPDGQLRRLRQLEAQLDQCWAQLRRSRGEHERTTGLDGATPTPTTGNEHQTLTGTETTAHGGGAGGKISHIGRERRGDKRDERSQ